MNDQKKIFVNLDSKHLSPDLDNFLESATQPIVKVNLVINNRNSDSRKQMLEKIKIKEPPVFDVKNPQADLEVSIPLRVNKLD